MNRRDLFKAVPAALFSGLCVSKEKEFVPPVIPRGSVGETATNVVLSLRDKLRSQGLDFNETYHISVWSDPYIHRMGLRGLYGWVKDKRDNKKIGFSSDWDVDLNMCPDQVCDAVKRIVQRKQS